MMDFPIARQVDKLQTTGSRHQDGNKRHTDDE